MLRVGRGAGRGEDDDNKRKRRPVPGGSRGEARGGRQQQTKAPPCSGWVAGRVAGGTTTTTTTTTTITSTWGQSVLTSARVFMGRRPIPPLCGGAVQALPNFQTTLRHHPYPASRPMTFGHLTSWHADDLGYYTGAGNMPTTTTTTTTRRRAHVSRMVCFAREAVERACESSSRELV